MHPSLYTETMRKLFLFGPASSPILCVSFLRHMLGNSGDATVTFLDNGHFKLCTTMKSPTSSLFSLTELYYTKLTASSRPISTNAPTEENAHGLCSSWKCSPFSKSLTHLVLTASTALL